ncbi:ras-related protein Rap-1b-like [Penaeus monodon]|uniref:ras-related protein Rap-1b-like n=1 Tax=Penaeus monodon TaxID=6687 RepID=UPI0018A7D939|nr:ras-related protein Rap-1b-like [Penaeus monodon]XP_037804353.1 ras-related protein Rap-1b-like [Penaeus monodon]XP_037804354.1 ras-related protein Rap-1b-like [Penaeus monodon]
MKRSKEKNVLKTRKSVEEDEVPKRNDKCKRDRESEKGTPSTMKESKLVILGAGGVGKTSLVLQFLQGFFSTTYKPTVEDCYSHTLQLPNGLFHALEILDTAGSHHFPAMRELSIRSGRAFVIVFAVNNEQSFYEAQSLWNLITKIKGSDGAPVVVVGNKVDLDRERVVSFQRAQDWVDTDMSNASYLETSAKYNINVGELFKQLLIRTYGLANNEMAPTGARGRLKSLGNIMEVVRRRSFSLAQAASCSAIPDHPDIRDQKCAIL